MPSYTGAEWRRFGPTDTTYPVRLTINKVGNGTEYPVYVKLRMAWCRNDTWAMGYARNESQQMAADGCSAANKRGVYRPEMGPGRSPVRQQRSMERICGPDPATFDEDENVEDRIIMGHSFWDMNGHGKSGGMKLDRESWQVPLIADLPV